MFYLNWIFLCKTIFFEICVKVFKNWSKYVTCLLCQDTRPDVAGKAMEQCDDCGTASGRSDSDVDRSCDGTGSDGRGECVDGSNIQYALWSCPCPWIRRPLPVCRVYRQRPPAYRRHRYQSQSLWPPRLQVGHPAQRALRSRSLLVCADRTASVDALGRLPESHRAWLVGRTWTWERRSQQGSVCVCAGTALEQTWHLGRQQGMLSV